MARDIYNLKGRLESILHRIMDSDQVTEHNKELIREFYVEFSGQGWSISRVIFYLNRLWNIARWVKGKKLDEMSESEIKELVTEISYMDYKRRTKLDHNQTIKKFFQILDGDNRRVRNIRTNLRRHEVENPGKMLDKDDVKTLVKAAMNPRDKALISMILEGGMRIGEIATVQIKHLEFDNYGAIAHVDGKTGPRPVRLVASVPHLSNWIEHHPDRDDPEAYLWVGIGTRSKGRPLTYNSIYMMLRKVAKRAGITKKVNPQHFRRSRSTDLSPDLTAPQMENYMGWVRGSRMPPHYIFLSGRDTDPAILELYGILPKGKKEDNPLKPQTCFFCKHENSSELDNCMNCHRPLNMRALIEEQAKEKALANMVTPDMIEAMIEEKVLKIFERYGIWKEKPEAIHASTDSKT